MKLPRVAFVLASMLAFAALGVSTFAVDNSRAASMIATKSAVVTASLAAILGSKASVGDTIEWMVAATPRHEEREAPPEPADRHHHRSVLAIQVSVDDLLDWSRRALQERTYP